MDRINTDNQTPNFWYTKYILWPDDQGYVYKYFKKDSIYKAYPFEEQSNIIERKKQYIWKFIPETELIKNEDGSYYVKQKYIKWKLLKHININQLNEQVLSDLLDLLNWYISYCKHEWREIDVLWCQQDIYDIGNVRKRKLIIYNRSLNGFLLSTNIMISNDNKVYMVDICDTIPVQTNNHKLHIIKHTVKQIVVALSLKIAKSKISHLIRKKKRELFDTLS